MELSNYIVKFDGLNPFKNDYGFAYFSCVKRIQSLRDLYIKDNERLKLRSEILNLKNNQQFNFNSIKHGYKFDEMEFHMEDGIPFFIFDDKKYTIEDVVKLYNELEIHNSL